LVSNRSPQEVQSASISALARYNRPPIAGALLDAWSTVGPGSRAEIAEALFSRTDWLTALIERVERGELSLADLDAARLQQLEKHSDQTLRERAKPLLAKARLGRRPDVVDAYRSALAAEGDASRGRTVFSRVCASCHRLEGVGHEIGPSLASFRNRGSEAILINVLDPNREVNPQFVNYVLVTQDGRSLTGLVASETANSVTLKRADDATDTVERADIEELHATGLSIMPEGLEKQIDVGQMTDLLTYLLKAS
jgi:putative heme-binding domain-containing protein